MLLLSNCLSRCGWSLHWSNDLLLVDALWLLLLFLDHLNVLLDFSLLSSAKLWRTYRHLSAWVLAAFGFSKFRFYFVLRLKWFLNLFSLLWNSNSWYNSHQLVLCKPFKVLSVKRNVHWLSLIQDLVNFFLLLVLCAFSILQVVSLLGELLFHLIHRVVLRLSIIIENWHFVLDKLTQWLSRLVDFHVFRLKKIGLRVLHIVRLQNVFLWVRSRSSTTFNGRGAADPTAINCVELACG